MNTITVFSVINTASFSFGAILVCLTCLVYMVLRGRFEKSQSKLFLTLVVILLVNAVCSMTAEVLKGYVLVSNTAVVGVRVSNYVYFIAHTMLAPMVCVYFLVVCGRAMKWRSASNMILLLPFAVAELAVAVNPITGWVYYYGPDMVFTRNWAVYVLYGVAVFYILFGVIMLLRNWRALTPVKRRAIAYLFIMVCLGVSVQLVQPEVRIELFAESVAILGVMLFVENEDEFIDSETGVYNRNALKANLDSFIGSRSKAYVIVVRVTNADSFTRIDGSARARQNMVAVVAEHMRSIVPWYRIYRTAPAQYALFETTVDEQGALEIANKIADRFKRSWDYKGMAIDLHAVVAVACIPDDMDTPDDVLYFIDSPAPPINESTVLGRSDLGYLMRQAEVERAVQRGFTESNYEVFYQPIFNLDGVVVGAEALMRLHDPVLGDIPPFEFINVAERIGFIEAIGDFALREVCMFLASGIPQRLGLEVISVNLSVIQCMQAQLPNHIKVTIEEYGVNPQSIGFEITESVASGNYAFLDRTMGEIREYGHHFSMDDYGTGYSNMHSLIALEFDVVKIDKDVLWDAEKSDTGRAVLEHSVGLLRNIGRKVLVEGVETESQVALLKSLHVDYFQGYHFAKPMPKDEFVSFVEHLKS